MPEYCANCDAEITFGGIIKAANWKYDLQKINLVNFVNKTEHVELCEKCGKEDYEAIFIDLTNKIDEDNAYIKNNISDFPMITISQFPAHILYKIKMMITANVTVGTGFFSEFSQGVSDIFGRINTDTGMAYKVNSGEGTARSILANKALSIGANCIIGVDIDYGTTANNAATINMQGTAVSVSNLAEILDAGEFAKAQKIDEAYRNIIIRSAWLKGNFQDSIE